MSQSRMEFSGADGNRLAADLHRPSDGIHGLPVLLVHGGGQTRYAWGTAARRIAAAGHSAYTFDQRGHGESEWVSTGAYSFDDYGRDMIAVARQITASEGRAPVLVGASLGGISGLLALGDAGDGLLSGLVLVDVTPHMNPDGVRRIQGFMADRLHEGFSTLEEASEAISAYLPQRKRPRSLEGLSKNLRRGEDGRFRWHWDPAFIDGPRSIGTDRANIESRLVAAAQSLRLPVLLVRGQQSELVTEEAANAFRGLVPHARFVDVSGAGHMVAGDRNDVFNEAVLGFLDSL